MAPDWILRGTADREILAGTTGRVRHSRPGSTRRGTSRRAEPATAARAGSGRSAGGSTSGDHPESLWALPHSDLFLRTDQHCQAYTEGGSEAQSGKEVELTCGVVVVHLCGSRSSVGAAGERRRWPPAREAGRTHGNSNGCAGSPFPVHPCETHIQTGKPLAPRPPSSIHSWLARLHPHARRGRVDMEASSG